MDLKSADPSLSDELDIDGDLPLEEGDIVFDFEEITDPNDPAWIEAEADIAAGRFVSNERVMEWVKSWGTPNELPMPQSWRK